MVIMKKTILLTMTTLTLFSMSPNSAQAYTTNDSKTLEEAKKAHPNAQFKVNEAPARILILMTKTTRQTTIIKISHVQTTIINTQINVILTTISTILD